MDSEASLDERDRGWAAALLARDQQAVVDFLHDDYALVLVHPGPARMPREEWVRTLPGYVIESWQTLGSTWDVQPTFAAHLHVVDQRADVFGTRRDGLFALTDIWQLVDGSWKVWRRHSTPLTASELPRA